MIKKSIWFWKGSPENLLEFKEIIILWLITGLGFGILFAMIIKIMVIN